MEANAAISFTGNSHSVLTEHPQASTGLNDVYVLHDINGVAAQYTASSASATVKWYRYSSLGGGYAEEVPSVQNGRTSTLSKLEGNMGYIVEDGSSRYYCWVVDYSQSPLTLTDISISPESDCATTVITAQGQGERLLYYTINGAPQQLSRDIELSYNTLVWNESTASYQLTETITSYPYLTTSLHATAPLCDTEFHLSGDKFLRAWGEEVAVNSDTYPAIAVSAHTEAIQSERTVDNEKESNTSASFGGSAPCEIAFSATPTDAAVFKEWQFATDADFSNLTHRYNTLDVTYTFTEQGTVYVRFMASNNAGSCDYYGETYEIEIGESSLECPNAFSPGSTEGINDEWKVSYKSIVTFECHIFNRWGQLMAELTDPSQGWDGRYKGKPVPAGVYFYVIKATGSDGRKYKLNGDINIINYKDNRQTYSN
jgi:gliding motility-associated-like protein